METRNPVDYLGNVLSSIFITLPEDTPEEDWEKIMSVYSLPPVSAIQVQVNQSIKRAEVIKSMLVNLFLTRINQGYTIAQMLSAYRQFKEPIDLSLLGAVNMAIESIEQIKTAALALPEPAKSLTLALAQSFIDGLNEANV